MRRQHIALNTTNVHAVLKENYSIRYMHICTTSTSTHGLHLQDIASCTLYAQTVNSLPRMAQIEKLLPPLIHPCTIRSSPMTPRDDANCAIHVAQAATLWFVLLWACMMNGRQQCNLLPSVCLTTSNTFISNQSTSDDYSPHAWFQHGTYCSIKYFSYLVKTVVLGVSLLNLNLKSPVCKIIIVNGRILSTLYAETKMQWSSAIF